MNCEDVLAKLSLYIDGELSQEEKAELESHLETCAECSNRLSLWRDNIEKIRQTLTTYQPSKEFAQRVMTALPSRHKVFKYIGIAAGVLITFLALAIIYVNSKSITHSVVTPYLISENISISAEAYKITGPYTHDNLTLFLIHGEDANKEDYMILEEALSAGTVVISEKGEGQRATVNTLEIENKGEKPIFVQAGDIVKGGKQDRTIAVDLIVPSKSGTMPIPAFCVESGRWTRRDTLPAGASNATTFGGSAISYIDKDYDGTPSADTTFSYNIMGAYTVKPSGSGDNNETYHNGVAIVSAPSKEMKLAIKKDADQGKVWDGVARAQTELQTALSGLQATGISGPVTTQVYAGTYTGAMGYTGVTAQGWSVRSVESPTSLQLTLENQKVQETVDAYIEALGKVIKDKNDVIGYAFAINGELNSADVYSSNALFRKLWLKLLRASATEALAKKTDAKFDQCNISSVRDCFDDVQKGKKSVKDVNGDLKMITSETNKNILFETCEGDTIIHRNYVAY